jgi:hypothetical protein
VAQSDASLDHRGVPAVPAYCGLERAEGLPVIVIGTQLNLGQNRAYVTLPGGLRRRLVDGIVKERVAGLYDARVEEAMRAVPRPRA